MADNGYLVLSPEEQARQIAQQYLDGGQSSAVAPPAPAMSMAPQGVPVETPTAPIGPPPPPPAEHPSMVGQIAKKTAIRTVGGLLGGPIGQWAAGRITDDTPPPPGPAAAPSAAPSGRGEFGPPPPPEPTEDPPILLSRPGMGQARMVAPAGMYPQSMTAQSHLGRAVPQEAKSAYAAGTGLELEGIERERDANQAYRANERNMLEERMRASEDARVSHARVQAERQAMVQNRLAEIEAFNAEASAAIDPEKYWHDRGGLARVLGGIFVGLGQLGAGLSHTDNRAAAIIENNVNREVQAQLSNRQLAGQKAARAERLLDLHLDRLGSEDKAIEATKLGLYDNIVMQMDQFAADRGIAMDDANYMKLRGDVLAKRGDVLNRMALQETDDINKAYTEQWHNAQYAGGGGGTAKSENLKHIITVPASDRTKEKTIRVAVDEGVYKELAAQQGMTNTLVDLNNQALEARRELREATARFYQNPMDTKALSDVQTLRKRLQGLQNSRVVLAQKAQDPNSAVRDPEFQRELESGVDYTAGILGRDSPLSGDTEKAIQNSSNTAQSLSAARLRGATGQVVKQGINRDAQGRLVNEWLPTGELYSGKPIAPEKK